MVMIRLGSRANDSFLMSSPGSLVSLTRSPTKIHLEGIINNYNGNNYHNYERNIRKIKKTIMIITMIVFVVHLEL